jgi:hypothetical protein
MMKEKKTLPGLLGAALVACMVASCGSNTSSCDETGCVAPDAGSGGNTYALSQGTYCYDITGVSAVSDGCQISVGSLVGQSLPGTYDGAGGFTLGTDGSLGTGNINANTGVLSRDGNPTDPGPPVCSWHQTDTSTLTMTAQNTFTVSVVETENTFANTCSPIPTGGTCTSSWTWTMAINGNKTAPGCL